MKKILLLIIVVFLVLIFFYHRNQTQPPQLAQGRSMLKYKTFSSQTAGLDFTFEYPETGWPPVESRGSTEKYDLVYLKGPVDKVTNFTTVIHVTVRPSDEGKTAGDLLETYLKMNTELLKYRVLSKEKTVVGGKEAVDAFYEFESIPSYSLTEPRAKFKNRMIFIVRSGKSYEFTMSTLASKYEAYAPVLEHVLKTFKFKD